MRGDSEALLQAVRFLEMWEGDSEALLQAVRFLEMWECDRPSADLSVRSQWRNFWN
ncbi:hypothetical protein [Dolichospermum circinale]|uniref:hypothetical protein n=1 Tax=Dolichospermum circinale TaxID=109265 RepID=UPI00232D96C1|nr:hypothetical protein [Dolichospermum circinale]MDB9456373.1 hypothetical protein [Dolichospermum circinale CS-541/06]MDB9461465.1 hypothetical protein [Dolichospermum circinale CS-541/04]MDB9547512.1 hypothetical protein [Dolichospermum circinale CS-1031]